MSIGEILIDDGAFAATMRVTPAQRRSADRLDTLLDATAQIVDEVGFDLLTTAMVAERAGASIGTVYRYFPDRIAVLLALRDRAVHRYRDHLTAALEQHSAVVPRTVVTEALETTVSMYRTEPGFRIVEFADPRGAHCENCPRTVAGELAARIAAVLSDELGVDGGPEVQFALDVAFTMASALIARAFAVDASGEDAFLSTCRTLTYSYLEPIVGIAE